MRPWAAQSNSSTAAVGERVVPLAAEDRDAHAAAGALARASSAAAPGIGEAAPTAT